MFPSTFFTSATSVSLNSSKFAILVATSVGNCAVLAFYRDSYGKILPYFKFRFNLGTEVSSTPIIDSNSTIYIGHKAYYLNIPASSVVSTSSDYSVAVTVSALTSPFDTGTLDYILPLK